MRVKNIIKQSTILFFVCLLLAGVFAGSVSQLRPGRVLADNTPMNFGGATTPCSAQYNAAGDATKPWDNFTSQTAPQANPGQARQILGIVSDQSGIPGQAKQDLADDADGANRVVITFTSVGNGDEQKTTCAKGLYLIQSGADPTTFYGFAQDGAGQGYDYMSAHLNVSANQLTIGAPVSQTVAVIGLNASAFPSGGGISSAGATSCPNGQFSRATNPDLTKLCITAAGGGRFTNFATITWGGAYWSLASWSGSQMQYKITPGSSNDTAWDQSGNTYLYVNVNSGGASGGNDNKVNTESLNVGGNTSTDINNFIAGLQHQNGNTIHMGLVNMGSDTGNTQTVAINASDMLRVAGYYSQGDKIVTDATSGGGNETNFIGNYIRSAQGSNKFIIESGTTWGCSAAESRPQFQLSSDPATADSGDGFIGATWLLPDSTCTMHTVPVQVYTAGKALAPPTTSGNAQQGSGGSGNTTPTCDTTFTSPESWILCPIFDGVAAASTWLFNNLVSPLLQSSPISLDPNNPTYKVWSNFRIYGNILLVIFLLIVVFGQSIGGGIIDAYTAKKILPRILIAGILTNLSLYIVAALVDITNIIGGSIGYMINSGFADNGTEFFQIHLTGIGGIIPNVGVAGAGIGLFALIRFGALASVAKDAALGMVIFIIMPVLLGLLAAFLTIIIRRGIILILVLISPIAFALYCLPNTEKYFRKWWDTLFEALMVYPIVVVFFAVANVLSVTIMQGNGSASDASQVVTPIVSFVLQFLPLLLIPYAFRLAGGLVGKAHELVSNSSKRFQEGVKGNPNDPLSLRNKAKRNLMNGYRQTQQRVVDAGTSGETGKGARRRRIASNIAGSFLFGGDPTPAMSHHNEAMNKLSEAISATGRDDVRYAAAGFKVDKGDTIPAAALGFLKDFDGAGGHQNAAVVADRDRYFNAKGKEVSRGMYRRSKSLLGSSTGGLGAQLEYANRKINTREDAAAFMYSFGRNARAKKWNEKEVTDAWNQAVYPHKQERLSMFHSSPYLEGGQVKFHDIADNSVGASGTKIHDKQIDAYTGETHRTIEQYKRSGMRGDEANSIAKVHKNLETEVASNVAARTAIDNKTLVQLARMDETIDQVTRTGSAMYTGEDGVQAAGPNAEASNILTAAARGRQYATTTLVKDAAGNFVQNTSDRTVYDRAAYETWKSTVPRGGASSVANYLNTPGAIVGVARGVAQNNDQQSAVARGV